MNIREASYEDYPYLKQIAEDRIGKGFGTKQHFFGEDDCLIVEIDDKVVAYGTIGIVDKETYPELEKYLTKKTGILHTLAVARGYERRGIATKLVRARIQFLEDLGCDSIVTTAMRTKTGGVHVEKILLREGFEQVEVIPNYWSGSDCVYCDEECSCDAVVFRLKFGR